MRRKWAAKISGRPPAQKRISQAKLMENEWAKRLWNFIASKPERTKGPVDAEICIYISENQTQKSGDIDNYANNILNILEGNSNRSGVLRDDRDVSDLHVRRLPARSKKFERVEITLRWTE